MYNWMVRSTVLIAFFSFFFGRDAGMTKLYCFYREFDCFLQFMNLRLTLVECGPKLHGVLYLLRGFVYN